MSNDVKCVCGHAAIFHANPGTGSCALCNCAGFKTRDYSSELAGYDAAFDCTTCGHSKDAHRVPGNPVMLHKCNTDGCACPNFTFNPVPAEEPAPVPAVDNQADDLIAWRASVDEAIAEILAQQEAMLYQIAVLEGASRESDTPRYEPKVTLSRLDTERADAEIERLKAEVKSLREAANSADGANIANRCVCGGECYTLGEIWTCMTCRRQYRTARGPETEHSKQSWVARKEGWGK